MSSVKTDVNPSDIGTKAPGRERFHRLRSMLGMGTELSETSSPCKWYRRMTVEISGYEYDEFGRVERSTHVSMRRFLKLFSVQQGTPRESDTASRREEACLWNLCNVVAQRSHHSLIQ